MTSKRAGIINVSRETKVRDLALSAAFLALWCWVCWTFFLEATA